MVEIMIFGPMETDKNQYPAIAKSMKSLLIQYYIRQREETNHEIFRKNL